MWRPRSRRRPRPGRLTPGCGGAAGAGAGAIIGARRTGSSGGQAVEAIDAARRLESLPAVAAAARAGGLSAAQSAAVSAAVAADPAAEGRLLEAWGRGALGRR